MFYLKGQESWQKNLRQPYNQASPFKGLKGDHVIAP